MKVLVADAYPEQGLGLLREIGCEIQYTPEAKGPKLLEVLQTSGADVLVVRSSQVTREMLQAGKLALVVRAGAGYNTIDVKAASELGIYVSNCPGKNSVAVAELAFGLVLALDRRIADNVVQLRSGRWNKKELSKARGLMGRTLGLLGVGNIGREVIVRARAFGMPVIGWSRSLTAAAAEELGIEHRATPEQVAASCDVLSVHLALNNDTRGLVGATVFSALRPGALFINTSRAEVVDQEALAKAIADKGIRAGLDVYAHEPAEATGTIDDPLAKNEAVYGTHHIGASTDQAQEAISLETARIIRAFKETGRVPNVVNLIKRSPARFMLVVRHRDRVGVLAHVLTALKEEGVNVQEMENVIFEGALSAVARIQVDKSVPQAALSSIKGSNADILDLDLLPLEG
jgi:D-3-phosphoglycerate dehydrogenase